MPLYEYKCENEKCQEEFETLVKWADADKKQPCPKCEGETKKKISRTSFSLKGGGWAADGYGGGRNG